MSFYNKLKTVASHLANSFKVMLYQCMTTSYKMLAIYSVNGTCKFKVFIMLSKYLIAIVTD